MRTNRNTPGRAMFSNTLYIRNFFYSALVALYYLPALVLAQDTSYFDAAKADLENIINGLLALFATIALALFIWGIINFIVVSGDDKERAAGRRMMIWGVVALCVIVGMWGFVNFILTVFDVDPSTVVNVPSTQ